MSGVKQIADLFAPHCASRSTHNHGIVTPAISMGLRSYISGMILNKSTFLNIRVKRTLSECFHLLLRNVISNSSMGHFVHKHIINPSFLGGILLFQELNAENKLTTYLLQELVKRNNVESYFNYTNELAG